MHRLLAVGTILALAACAAATPGYEPPNSRMGKMRYKDPGGGGFHEDGSYALNADELKLDCRHLTGSISVRLVQLREMKRRLPPSELSKLADKAHAVFGYATHGVDPAAEYLREKAKVEAYNRRLAEKSCKTVDIEAGLVDTGGTTPPPPPVLPPSPPKKK